MAGHQADNDDGLRLMTSFSTSILVRCCAICRVGDAGLSDLDDNTGLVYLSYVKSHIFQLSGILLTVAAVLN